MWAVSGLHDLIVWRMLTGVAILKKLLIFSLRYHNRTLTLFQIGPFMRMLVLGRYTWHQQKVPIYDRKIHIPFMQDVVVTDLANEFIVNTGVLSFDLSQIKQKFLSMFQMQMCYCTLASISWHCCVHQYFRSGLEACRFCDSVKNFKLLNFEGR